MYFDFLKVIFPIKERIKWIIAFIDAKQKIRQIFYLFVILPLVNSERWHYRQDPHPLLELDQRIHQ